MKLSLIYEQLKNRIDRVNLSSLWTGFHSYKFAIYNDAECFFNGEYIEKTSEFLANTAIKYNNEFIAIWYLESEPNDLDCLAASLVHEMFHAFQQENEENRFPNEFEALFQYTYFEENISIKISEAKLMRDIIITNNTNEFYTLLNLRRFRKEKFKYEFDYESKVEQIEGTACFIEISVLTIINPEKGLKSIERMLIKIIDSRNYFPIRVISYDIGALFIYCIRKSLDFKYEFFSNETFGQRLTNEIALKSIVTEKNEIIVDQILEFKYATNKIIEVALDKNEIVLSGNYPLCGLNIYDARWNGHYATSNFFVSYEDKDEVKILYGNFVLEIDKDYRLINVYNQ